jgi:hypothetical protein
VLQCSKGNHYDWKRKFVLRLVCSMYCATQSWSRCYNGGMDEVCQINIYLIQVCIRNSIPYLCYIFRSYMATVSIQSQQGRARSVDNCILIRFNNNLSIMFLQGVPSSRGLVGLGALCREISRISFRVRIKGRLSSRLTHRLFGRVVMLLFGYRHIFDGLIWI